MHANGATILLPEGYEWLIPTQAGVRVVRVSDVSRLQLASFINPVPYSRTMEARI